MRTIHTCKICKINPTQCVGMFFGLNAPVSADQKVNNTFKKSFLCVKYKCILPLMKRALKPTLAILLGMSAPAFADQAERGEKVFKKCASCHKIGEDAKNGVGPHLSYLFGRTAGTIEGYKYSKAMKAAGAEGLVWTEQTLNAFLIDPKKYMKKTKMKFRGLKKEADRAAVIAFLGGGVESHTKQGDPAVDSAVLAIEGDAEYGEYLSSECVTCHRADGADDGIPSITEWPTDEFVIALHAYKTKHRDNPAMQLIAGQLGDEEIAALAAYFAQPVN